MRRFGPLVILLITMFFVMPCQLLSAGDKTPKDLASYRGGVVSADDLDNELFGATPAAIRSRNKDRGEWHRELIRQIVVERELFRRAGDTEADQEPTLVDRLHELEKQLVVAEYEEQNPVRWTPVNDREVRDFYDNNRGNGTNYDLTMPQIRQKLEAERQRIARNRQVSSLKTPAGYFVVQPKDFQNLLENAKTPVPLYRIGNDLLTVGQFRLLLKKEIQGGYTSDGPRAAQRILDRLVRHARIYDHCINSGMLNEPEIKAKLQRIRRHELVAAYRNHLIKADLDKHPLLLDQYYALNKMRFVSPLRLDVRRLRAPITQAQQAQDVAAILNRIARSSTDFERNVLRIGGQIEQMGLLDLKEIDRRDHLVALHASTLRSNQRSAPFRNGRFIEIIEVLSRIEPAPLPLARIRERVLASYLKVNNEPLIRALYERLLTDVQLQFFEKNLTAYALGH